VDPDVKVFIGEVSDISDAEPFAHEKLSPCLALYKCSDFEDGLEKARKLGREFCERKCGSETSAEYPNRSGRERKYALVPTSPQGLS